MIGIILSFFKGKNMLLYGGIAVIGIGIFLYITNLSAQSAQLKAERDQLISINNSQNEQIDKLILSQQETAERVRELARDFNDIEAENRELRDKLIRHDLKELAKRKPGLIEKRINDGTQEVIDELNEITAT